jgi:hypothetical protein
MTATENIKTTVFLPYDLWRAVRVRAIDERTNARAILIRALRAYLESAPKVVR